MLGLRMAKPKQIISVGGGKGGVGKSVVAANLAIALAQRGRQVVLADMDLGMANQHTLFGIDHPGPTVQAFLQHEIPKLSDALLPTACRNLQLLPGSGAHMGAANINHAQKTRLIRHLHGLPADILLIDVGAGMHYNTLDFFLAADVRLLVMTPQLVSLQNAYSFLKVALYRNFRNVAKTAEQRALLDTQHEGGELQRVHDMIVEMSQTDPAYGSTVQRARQAFGLHLVGNMMNSSQDLNVLHAMGRMVGDFLGLRPGILGHLRASRGVHDSVTRRRPLALENMGHNADGNQAIFRVMAMMLDGMDVPQLRHGRDEQDFENATDTGAAAEGPLPVSLKPYSRRHERFSVHLPVLLEVRGGPGQVAADFEELSAAGALLVAAVELQLNQRIELHIPASTADLELLITGTVRNKRADGKGYGIEFDEEQNHLVGHVVKKTKG